MSKRREFSVEYKKEIIKLVTEQGRKATHVAKEIGVSEASVRRWVNVIRHFILSEIIKNKAN